jgi:hypothetical protein
VIFLHFCKGVKTPTVARKPLKIITPEQFDAIHEALPDPASRLLIETDIESGLRWGELTELRVRDLDLATRMLTVSRAVVQVNPKFHPDGLRFLVKPYPKDKERSTAASSSASSSSASSSPTSRPISSGTMTCCSLFRGRMPSRPGRGDSPPWPPSA